MFRSDVALSERSGWPICHKLVVLIEISHSDGQCWLMTKQATGKPSQCVLGMHFECAYVC